MYCDHDRENDLLGGISTFSLGKVQQELTEVDPSTPSPSFPLSEQNEPTLPEPTLCDLSQINTITCLGKWIAKGQISSTEIFVDRK